MRITHLALLSVKRVELSLRKHIVSPALDALPSALHTEQHLLNAVCPFPHASVTH